MKGNNVEFSRTEQFHLISPNELNASGRFAGGIMVKLIDEIAAVVAMRHAQCSSVTTVSIDNLEFREAAHLNDLIVMNAYVTYTGNTSLEVCVESYIENRQGNRRLINRAFVVLVVLDSNEKPCPVIPLIVENESDKARWAAAYMRKKVRVARKKEGF